MTVEFKMDELQDLDFALGIILIGDSASNLLKVSIEKIRGKFQSILDQNTKRITPLYDIVQLIPKEIENNMEMKNNVGKNN